MIRRGLIREIAARYGISERRVRLAKLYREMPELSRRVLVNDMRRTGSGCSYAKSQTALGMKSRVPGIAAPELPRWNLMHPNARRLMEKIMAQPRLPRGRKPKAQERKAA